MNETREEYHGEKNSFWKNFKNFLIVFIMMLLTATTIIGFYLAWNSQKEKEEIISQAESGLVNPKSIPTELKELFDENQNIKKETTFDDLVKFDTVEERNISTIKLVSRGIIQLNARETVNRYTNAKDELLDKDLIGLTAVKDSLKSEDINYLTHLEKQIKEIEERVKKNTEINGKVISLVKGNNNGSSQGQEVLNTKKLVAEEIKGEKLKSNLIDILNTLHGVTMTTDNEVFNESKNDNKKENKKENTTKQEDKEYGEVNNQGSNSLVEVGKPE